MALLCLMLATSLGAQAQIAPGPERLLNAYGTSDQGDTQIEDWGSHVATDNGGNWVAVWESDALPSSTWNYTVRAIYESHSPDGGATWSAPAVLNARNGQNAEIVGIHPFVASDETGTWLACWASGYAVQDGASYKSVIAVSRSTDAGAAWSAPVFVDALRTDDHPTVAPDGAGNWVLVWETQSIYGTSETDIMVSRSTDDGLTWSAPALLDPNGNLDETYDNTPWITTDRAGLWRCVWASSTRIWDQFEVAQSESTDLGVTWTTPALVTDSSDEKTSPSITTDRQGAWATSYGLTRVCADRKGNWFRIQRTASPARMNLAKASSPSGPWVTRKYYSHTFSGLDSWLTPAIAADQSGVVVAIWPTDTLRGSDVVFARSTDAGETWSTSPLRLDANAVLDLPGNDQVPMVGYGNGVWLSMWIADSGDTAAQTQEWMVARSTDSGVVWASPMPVSVAGMTYGTAPKRAELATDGAGKWLLPVLGGKSVVHSEDDGQTWSAPVSVFPSTYAGGDAAMACGGGVCVMAAVTQDYNGFFNSIDDDISTSRSTDNGATWSAPVKAASYMGSDSLTPATQRPPGTNDSHPSLATDGQGNWLVAWTITPPGGSNAIYAARSSDSGQHWSAPSVVSAYAGTDTYVDGHAVVRTDGAGHWLACWLNGDNTTHQYRLLTARSTDNGQTWGAVVVLDDGGDSSIAKQNLDLSMDSQGFCVASWSSTSIDSDLDVFAIRSEDAGQTWSAPTLLNRRGWSDGGAQDSSARLATDGAGGWLAVWQSELDLPTGTPADNDIHYTRFGNEFPPEGEVEGVMEGMVEGGTEGQSEGAADGEGVFEDGFWAEGETPVGAEALVNTNGNADASNGTEWLPRIATDSAGNWVAVWESVNNTASGSDPDVYSAHSSDLGATWSAATLVNDTGTGDDDKDRFPVIATDGAGVWLAAWEFANKLTANQYEDGEIRFSRSTDNGATWSPSAYLNTTAASDGTDGDGLVQLAYSGGGHWVAVWQSIQHAPGAGFDDYNVMGAHSDDNGLTWSEPALLVPNALYQFSDERNPVVACDGAGNCLIACEFSPKYPVDPEPSGSDRDLKFAHSSDHGHTWSDARILNQNGFTDTTFDYTPQLAAGADGLWLAVWERLGAEEVVVVARSMDEGATWSNPVNISRNASTTALADRVPRVASYGGTAFAIVWSQFRTPDNTGYNVAMSYSWDGGLSWKLPTLLNQSADSSEVNMSDQFPDVALASDNQGIAIWTSFLDLNSGLHADYDIHATSFAVIPVIQEGAAEGIEGGSEGMPEGNHDGASEGSLEGLAEGIAEGVTEGIVEGAPEGLAEGTAEGTLEGRIEGIAEGMTEGVPEGKAEGEGEGSALQPHSLDLNGDGVIELGELLRAIQLYNAGGFGCITKEELTEDGYVVGGGEHSCLPHSGDYNPQDWILSISELLRLIQFYNLGGLHACPGKGSEDGFCVGQG